MPGRKVKDNRTGQVYTMPWDSPTPPSKTEIRGYIDSQVFPAADNKTLWDKANSPLWEGPSRAARAISSKIGDIRSRTSNPYIAGGLGAIEGGIEGAGDVASSFTSPVSLGLTAATLGSGTAARYGLGTASRGLTSVAKIGGAAMAGHGVYTMGSGVKERSPAKVGAGALETAGGLLGMHTPFPEIGNIPAPPTPKPAPKLLSTRIPEDIPNGPNEGTRFYQGRAGVADATKRYPMDTAPTRNVPTATLGKKTTDPTITPADMGDIIDLHPEYAAENGTNFGRPRWSAAPMGDIGTSSKFSALESRDLVTLARKGNRDAAMELSRRAITEAIDPDARAFVDQFKKGVTPAEVPIKKVGGAKKIETPVSEARQDELTAKFGGRQTQSTPADTPLGKVTLANLKTMAKTGSAAAKAEIKRRGETGSATIDFLTGGLLGGNKKAPVPPDPQKLSFDTNFADWVNKRHATKVEGALKSREFKSLDEKGMQGIFDFQSQPKTGLFANLKNYFDQKHDTLQAAGVKLGFKENYLPQLWDNSPEEVVNTAARLGLKPSFTMESVIENYKKGTEAGLKPKFSKISDLVGWYESRANKAIADRQFFDFLNKEGMIRPKKGTIPGWESLSPDHFPVYKFSGGKEVTYVAPKDVARGINNYLTIPPSEFDFRTSGAILQKVADLASYSKNFALSSGVPGTALNAHGFNILARNMMERGPLKGGVEALKFILNPGTHEKQSIPIGKTIEKIAPWQSAGSWLDQNLHLAPEAIKNGLMFSSEGHEMGDIGSSNLVGKSLHGLAEKHGKYFEDPLFQQVIPALKLRHYGDLKAELIKGGHNDVQAGKLAAKAANEAYGGINTEALQRSRDWGNFARAIVLAPDWLETNMKIGSGMARTLLNPKTPGGKVYGTIAKNLLGMYIAADAANYSIAKRHMWDNPPGRALSIYMGKSGDKDRYFSPFGTAADFARLPVEMLASAIQGDASSAFKIARNRMSIPSRAIGNLVFNTDDFSRPIYGKDSYGHKIPIQKQIGGIASQVAAPVVPPYAAALGDRLTGKLNTEQAAMSSAEMPMRYYTRPKPRGQTRKSF